MSEMDKDMKISKTVFAVLILSLPLLLNFGCGKKSRLEGKVVDGKNRPIAGVKVIARQNEPVEGYEQFESTTGSDGKFTFKKLYPTASYTLSIWHKDWKTDTTMTTEAAPEGETTLLQEPLKVLMTVDNEGIITDTATRLQWYVGSDNDTNWDEANLWVKSLSVGGGGGWRMPARAELRGFYDAGMEFDHWVWSGEIYSPSEAWAFLFYNGYDVYNDRSDSAGGRAFAVRNR